MNETDSKKGFWHYPITLKFAVVWIFLLSLGDFWSTLEYYIYAHSILIISGILGVAYFYLAIGLADRSNASRILTSVLVGIGTLIRFGLLIWMLFETDLSLFLSYFSVRFHLVQNQLGAFLILNIALNAIILYVLLRPSTKALFMRSSPPPALPPESTPQETP